MRPNRRAHASLVRHSSKRGVQGEGLVGSSCFPTHLEATLGTIELNEDGTLGFDASRGPDWGQEYCSQRKHSLFPNYEDQHMVLTGTNHSQFNPSVSNL